MKDPESLRIRDLEEFVKSIEDTVAAVDERFASVRIAEAA